MKRVELEALGLTKEQMHAVFALHHRDVSNKRLAAYGSAQTVRDSLGAICKLLTAPALAELLLHANDLYRKHLEAMTDEKPVPPETL